MNLIDRIQDKILRIFPVYKNLVDDWEKQNADIDTESARANKMIEKNDNLQSNIDEAIAMIEKTRLKEKTKNEIIEKLRG